MYCVHCGTRNNKADTHCTTCGKQLPERVASSPQPLPPRPKPMSKALYIILFLLPFVPLIVMYMNMDTIPMDDHETRLVLYWSMLGLSISSAATIMLIFIYKIWAAIQDGITTFTPGVAAWLLLIPIFNIYWMFRAVHGYAREYNAFLIRHQLNAHPLPSGTYLAYCILMCGSLLPLTQLSRISGFAAEVILFFVIIPYSINAVNSLAYYAEPEPRRTY